MSDNINIIRIAVVDDHQLFRKGLIRLIHEIDTKFRVVIEAENGTVFIDKWQKEVIPPDLVILDHRMPEMDGCETLESLRVSSEIPVLMLSMMDDQNTLTKSLKAGADGFLHKDVEPKELKTAINAVLNDGYYYPKAMAKSLVDAIRYQSEQIHLNEQELTFIKLACSDEPYKVISDKMCLSLKTIDGYRGKLFDKLNVKSRVGLVLYAFKENIVSLDDLRE